jgi:hypothetical protein
LWVSFVMGRAFAFASSFRDGPKDQTRNDVLD